MRSTAAAHSNNTITKAGRNAAAAASHDLSAFATQQHSRSFSYFSTLFDRKAKVEANASASAARTQATITVADNNISHDSALDVDVDDTIKTLQQKLLEVEKGEKSVIASAEDSVVSMDGPFCCKSRSHAVTAAIAAVTVVSTTCCHH